LVKGIELGYNVLNYWCQEWWYHTSVVLKVHITY